LNLRAKGGKIFKDESYDNVGGKGSSLARSPKIKVVLGGKKGPFKESSPKKGKEMTHYRRGSNGEEKNSII